MAKERVVRATFSTGFVLERGSISKIYTHAYLTGGVDPKGRRWGREGFSTSEAQCWRNMRSESAWMRNNGNTCDREEVVAVEVVAKRTKSDLAQLASDEASERILQQRPGEA